MIDHRRYDTAHVFYIGNRFTISIPWYRHCPAGCTRHYSQLEPQDDPCWFCQDDEYIPWYRGWIKQARMEWNYRVVGRFYEWWMVSCPRCADDPDLPDPFILNNSCAMCDGCYYIGRGRNWWINHGWRFTWFFERRL